VPRYSLRRTGTPEAIGLPERSLAALRGRPERVDWAARPREVVPAVWVTGPVPRRKTMEEVEPSFHLDEACTVRDLVIDDQTLWVETPRGLVIVFGCAHAGVLNTVDYVRRLAAERSSGAAGRARIPIADDGLPRVRALLGGMHLLRAGKDRREATVDALAGLGLELCGPCHCTGKRATDLLRSRLPKAFAEVKTGSRFELD
jgi:7,8-dihydropterin-6-yl-methyl-4-(beta-D-ribofuranosyl)aminobenzene 5'-phosphate synthase